MKARSKAAFVNQRSLAAELGVTDRRVRQLVEEHILPEPNEDGRYDLDLCQDRYGLFRDGSPRDWSDFYGEAEAALGETAALFAKACADGATTGDVRSASLAVQADASRMHFLSACKSKSKAEADLFHLIWKREEDLALGQLLGRGMQLLGKTCIVDEGSGEVIAALPVYPHVRPKPPAAPKRRRAKAA